ncbi:MAG: cyclic nucleotide-binding domain-containing protein [SAR324 cluster bacterium]|nr:cyclic nucleotide-binding domain-containing protein [SAR324 cluster bacterium]
MASEKNGMVLPENIRDLWEKIQQEMANHTDLLDDESQQKLHQITQRYGSVLANMVQLNDIKREDELKKQNARVELLKNVPLFKELAPIDLLGLAQKMQERLVKPGMNLLTQDQTADAVYYLEEGSVEIYVNNELVAVRGRNECFGEMSCLRGEFKASATVRTITFSRVLRIERKFFMEVVNKTPRLWKLLFRESSERLQMITRRLSEVLQHTPQGLVKVDRAGNITNEFSTQFMKYFNVSRIAGQPFHELMFQNDLTAKQDWVQVYPLLYEDTLMDFKQIAELFPHQTTLINSQGQTQTLVLSYYPCFNPSGDILAVDIGLEDITEKLALSRKSEHLETERRVMQKIYDNPDAYINVLQLMDESLYQLSRFEKYMDIGNPPASEFMTQLVRDIHSLKGSCGMFELTEIKDLAHHLEDYLKDVRQKSNTDKYFHMRQELAKHMNSAHMLLDSMSDDLKARLTGIVLSPERFQRLKQAAETANLEQLRQLVNQLETLPLRAMIKGWNDEIRRLSETLGKKVKFLATGDNIRVSKQIFEALSAPLVHVIRNSVDHGIELPEDRLRQDKEETGLIQFYAFTENNQLMIHLSDDGQGLNYENILRKAKQQNTVAQAQIESLSANGELWKILMLPGFSTAEEVTDLSGRGIGMNAVQVAVEELGGSLEIESQQGQGMTLKITIPEFV